jgi:hypothetical protein
MSGFSRVQSGFYPTSGPLLFHPTYLLKSGAILFASRFGDPAQNFYRKNFVPSTHLSLDPRPSRASAARARPKMTIWGPCSARSGRLSVPGGQRALLSASDSRSESRPRPLGSPLAGEAQKNAPKYNAQKSSIPKPSVYPSRADWVLLSKRLVAKCPILDHGGGCCPKALCVSVQLSCVHVQACFDRR